MSSDLAVSVSSLSKAYQIVHRGGRATTLAEAVTETLKNSRRRKTAETFWALRDVSFSVDRGEIVGIIGRNGAGKSTLLKVLSRITEPTAGDARIWGRVGSLLEVGTGFHPELTCTENIFLNGAILGMRRAEIARRFDDIVAFAEIDRFLDTPVKRFSSGMYIRLAFAVAAHLDTEILLVDEVLAVGDDAFQKKCVGKMGDVVRAGRTILFVSHNLQAVKSMCPRALLMEGGRLAADGPSDEVAARYLATSVLGGNRSTWSSRADSATGDVRLERISVLCRDDGRAAMLEAAYRTDRSIIVEMDVFLSRVPSGLCIGFDLVRQDGDIVLRTYQTDRAPVETPVLGVGKNRLQCTIPAGLLNAGTYLVCPRIGIHNQEWLVHEDALVSFRTVLSHGTSPYWNSLREHSRPGGVAPILDWTLISS